MKKEKKIDGIEKEETISDKRKILTRFILFIFFFVVSVVSLGFGFSSLFRVPAGWKEIEATNSSDASMSTHVQFAVYFYDEPRANQKLYKKIKNTYSTYAVKMFQLFDADNEYEKSIGIGYLNKHPNEVVEVEETFYKMLSDAKSLNLDYLYLGPILENYYGLFGESDVSSAQLFDPYYEANLASEYTTICSYIASKDIELELLGENKVKLNVSSDYMNFLSENNYINYIDFGYYKYAFYVDTLYDLMVANEIANFLISSAYGFFRCENTSKILSDFALIDFNEGYINRVGNLKIDNSYSILNYRTYAQAAIEKEYKIYPSAPDATHYIDVKDGLYKSFDDTLYVFSKDASLLEMLSKTYNKFIDPTSTLADFVSTDIHYIGFDDYKLVSDVDLQVTFEQAKDYQYSK